MGHSHDSDPVAWRWRHLISQGGWGPWTYQDHKRDERPFKIQQEPLYLGATAAPSPAPEMLDCGHHKTLAVKSAETGEFLYCELCDCRSARADAEKMEAEHAETIRQLNRALKDATEGETFMGEPVLRAASGASPSDPDEPTSHQSKLMRASMTSALIEARTFVDKLRVGVQVDKRDKMLETIDRALNFFPSVGASPEPTADLRDALEKLCNEAEGISELARGSAGHTNVACLLHRVKIGRAALAVGGTEPQKHPDYRDAYEGAREDLLDWKRRAQRAEAQLRVHADNKVASDACAADILAGREPSDHQVESTGTPPGAADGAKP